MAVVHEQTVMIKLSKLVKNSAEVEGDLVEGNFAKTLEDIVQELVDSSIIVEVEVK